MSDMPRYLGLCKTCEHDSTCTLRRDAQLEIIECEEFSIQPIPITTIPIRDLTPHADPIETARMGLCANCLNIHTCGFPYSGQNVLQCEEYMLDESNLMPSLQADCSKSAA